MAVKPFPIVGLGASAGGLEALEKFLAHVPPDSGIAFVVVTHLHPGHISLLPELLAKCTRMPVRQAADGQPVEPNTVYMSLPENYLAILHGTLHFMEPDEPGLLRLPIDYFFRSLAEDQKEKAIGIVLSGTGTDGTLGLKAIKGVAGMTMAQEPDTAKYSGMPASAIGAGLVDYILPVEQLPQQLVAYTHGPYLAAAENELPGEDGLSEPMQKIIVLLRMRTGHDFSVYKANTIRRRIERRVNVHQLKGPEQYLRLLKESEWRQVRNSPYRTTENVIAGLVVTFVDINRIKTAERAAQQARADAKSIVATVREPLLMLEEVLPRNAAFDNFKLEQNIPGIGRKSLFLNARRFQREPDAPGMILLAFEVAAADGTRKPARTKRKAAT